MALVKCPECGREISTLATTCPGCGAPVEASLRHADEKAESVVQNSESADNTLRGKRTDDPPLDEHGSPTAPQSVKKRDFRPAVVIGLLALAFLVGTYVFKESGGAGSNVSAESVAPQALDKFCGQAEFAQFCSHGRVTAAVCRADARDCSHPTLYSWEHPAQDPYAQEDPYAKETESEAARRYLSLRIGYLQEVYVYGNAVGCKVTVGGHNGADLMAQMLWFGTFGDPQPGSGDPFQVISFSDQLPLANDRSLAIQNGTHDATTGSCQYWHDHPEMVAAVEQTARNALSWATMRR